MLGLLLQLIIDASFSWARMLIALFLSIVISIGIGILAARSKRAGRIIIPILDVLQTLPILAFFPFVIFIVVATLPNYIGINAAVIFLIVTSMVWNIAFAVYESVSTLPNNLIEASRLYGLGWFSRMRKLYIPACMPRVAEQSILSWAVGLFYLVTSEIFSTGSAQYTVRGIGTGIAQLAFSGSSLYYALGIGVFILFVVATRFLLFRPFERYTTRYMEPQQRKVQVREVWLVRAFSGISSVHVPRIRMHMKRHARVPVPRVERRMRLRFSGFVGVLILTLALLAALFLTHPYLASYEFITLESLVDSFARVWFAFIVICAVSVPLATYIVFMSKKSSHYVTLFQILASIPATILLPAIAGGLAGVPHRGEITSLAIFFISGLWYMVFGMLSSARTLSPEVFEVKRSFGVRGWRAWKGVYIGALLPGMITGGITAIAGEWNASIVAEFFTKQGISGTSIVSSVGTGIGRLLDLSLANGNLLLVGIALINMTVMIVLIDIFVWKRLYRKIVSTWG